MQRDKRNYRILVIEDNPGDLIIVEDLLAEQILEPQITPVDSFKKAAALLQNGGTDYDVILLDLTLPDKNGQALITEMLHMAPFCPIIILTGYTNIDFSIRSISEGAYDYLLKDELNAVMLYKSIIYALERQKSIAALTRSEKRFSDLFHLSPQPMWVYDQDTLKFVEANKAAIAHYGYTEEELLSMTILDIRPEEEAVKIKELVKERMGVDGIFTGQFQHRKKNGEIIEVEVYSTSIQVEEKNLRSVIAIDITEKKQYEYMITKAIIKTQEDERYEIGGELHDNVCQILAASQLSLGMIKKLMPPGNTEWHDHCKEQISMALGEIRNLSHRLAPAFFDDSTLEEAFKRLFEDFNFEKKLDISLHFDKAINKYPISRDIQLNLYRILQEQFRNIQKYAQATAVEVDVLIYKHLLKMRIADNGVGFNISKARSGIGIANMKRRAELFSGNFDIDSSLGNGCTVAVTIPLAAGTAKKD